MPYVACPGCGTQTYAVRLLVLRADCLVCGTRLLSPGAIGGVPARSKRYAPGSRRKRQSRAGR